MGAEKGDTGIVSLIKMENIGGIHTSDLQNTYYSLDFTPKAHISFTFTQSTCAPTGKKKKKINATTVVPYSLQCRFPRFQLPMVNQDLKILFWP